MLKARSHRPKKESGGCPVLYITYDGLCDPLGSSQILPYLLSISQHTGPIHILSFEKKTRFKKFGKNICEKLKNQSAFWHPLAFSEIDGRLGSLAKVFDLLRMYWMALYIRLRYKTKIVHARSHIPALAGLYLKTFTGVKLLFDCRGLWVDERVDKGSWDLNKQIDLRQYNNLKKREHSLFSLADEIVVLTRKVVPEIVRLGAVAEAKITVIPCCADYDHFTIPSKEKIKLARQKLNIGAETVVLGYLGSIGKMYMFEEYLHLYEMMLDSGIDVIALIITPDIRLAESCIGIHLPREKQKHLRIQTATRDEVPLLLSAVDYLVSFIRPSYARQATSPTKNAEALASGIRLICNKGVGDVDEYVKDLKAGWMLDPDNKEEVKTLIEEVKSLLPQKDEELRQRSRKMFGLEVATYKYREIYERLKSSFK